MNMVDISIKTYEMLSEKHIEQGLDHKNERVTKVNYHRDDRNQRYELVDEPKKGT